MSSNPTPHIKPLTSIRFFAAFFVMLRHLGFQPDHLFFDAAVLGVALFFILSGFVLSFSYQDRLLNKEIPASRFYSARIARVYPTHIITFLIFILIFYDDLGLYKLRHYVYNVLLIQSFRSNQLYFLSFNAVSWSLSVEMFFYLLFPFLIKFKNKTLFLLAIVFISVKIIYPLVSDKNIAYVGYIMYVQPILRLPDFICGILLFRLRKNLLQCFNASMLQIFSILILCIFVYFSKYVTELYRFDIYFIIPAVLIIYSFSFNNGILGNLLSNKFLVLLGESSFSLYMIHSIIIKIFHKINSSNSLSDVFNWGVSILIIVISILLSVLMYKYIETPLKNRTLKFLNKFLLKSTVH